MTVPASDPIEPVISSDIDMAALVGLISRSRKRAKVSSAGT